MSSTLALDLIWRRLSRPFNLVHAVPALTGVPASDVADLVTLHLALSAEAEALLAAAPQILRSLASTTSSSAARSNGDVRGPIMWAETLTARANTFGADDIFVCAAPRREHDISENRVLVTALNLIARAQRSIATPAAAHFDADRLALIELNAATARLLLRSPRLKGVPLVVVGARELHKVSRGRRAQRYLPAIRLLQRRVEPLRGAELHTLCDPRSLSQHHALVLVMTSLQRRGVTMPQFRVAAGELVAGRLRYRNWRNATPAGNHGILVDQVLIDAPVDPSAAARNEALAALEQRAAGRRYCLVTTMDEADLAVDLVLDASGSAAPVPA